MKISARLYRLRKSLYTKGTASAVPWSFYNSGTKHMVFQKQKVLWMLSFGFVSGHDFSRAVRMDRKLGFSPWYSASCTKCLSGDNSKQCMGAVNDYLKEKSAGAKAQIFVPAFTARLKSCPDTKHQRGDSGENSRIPQSSIYPRSPRCRNSRARLKPCPSSTAAASRLQ